MNAALLHVGKQHRRDRGHVGGLRSGNAGDEQHGAEQHVGEPALDVADERGEEVHHRRRHPRHNDEVAEQNEQRHCKQNERTDAFVDATGNYLKRPVAGNEKISDCAEAERERDRHADQHAGPEHRQKEDDEVPVTHRLDRRRAQIKRDRNCGEDARAPERRRAVHGLGNGSGSPPA